MMIHPAVLTVSWIRSEEKKEADLIYPPSPRGFDRDAGSVTGMSSLGADAMVRVLKLTVGCKRRQAIGVYVEAALKILGAVVSLLSMPLLGVVV